MYAPFSLPFPHLPDTSLAPSSSLQKCWYCCVKLLSWPPLKWPQNVSIEVITGPTITSKFAGMRYRCKKKRKGFLSEMLERFPTSQRVFTHHHYSHMSLCIIHKTRGANTWKRLRDPFDGIEDQPFKALVDKHVLEDLPGCGWKNRG